MSLNILNITPVNKSINIPIDTTILVELDGPVDPFTVINGISLYTVSSGLWTGPDSAILDEPDISGIQENEDYVQYALRYTIDGNKIFIQPITSLLPDLTYYLSIFPGNDTSRYLSSPTTAEPTYLRDSSSDGIINILSAYTGNINGTFTLEIIGPNILDVTKNGEAVGEFEYKDGEELNLGELKISISNTFDIGDTISIDVFKAQGLTSIYKTSFVTGKYTTFEPHSQSLTVPPGNILDQLILPLKIVSTIPDNLSINNDRCNPITIKFNKPIKTDQNITSKIRITRQDILNELKRDISYYYKINNDTIKIYLV